MTSGLAVRVAVLRCRYSAGSTAVRPHELRAPPQPLVGYHILVCSHLLSRDEGAQCGRFSETKVCRRHVPSLRLGCRPPDNRFEADSRNV